LLFATRLNRARSVNDPGGCGRFARAIVAPRHPAAKLTYREQHDEACDDRDQDVLEETLPALVSALTRMHPYSEL